jgi:hypothetical protein
MGAGGIDVEIGTGQPREVKTLEQRQNEAALKKQQATVEAINLIADLRDNPGLVLVVEALKTRLVELAAADPQCQAFKKIIIGWRNKIDPVPALADQLARHALGPLANLIREPQAASEEIPA